MWPFRSRNDDGTLAEQVRALSERVLKLEERDTEQRLLVLDAAEKVANRLEDRVRKRRTAQQEEEPEVLDPGMLLREARARHQVPR